MSQHAAGLCAELFKPKEIQVIQDFIITGQSDLANVAAMPNVES